MAATIITGSACSRHATLSGPEQPPASGTMFEAGVGHPFGRSSIVTDCITSPTWIDWATSMPSIT